jgi:hypothetical protein
LLPDLLPKWPTFQPAKPAQFSTGLDTVDTSGRGCSCVRIDDALAAMFDPDAVAVPAQLDALMNQRLRGAVEAAGVLEAAVQRHPRRPPPSSTEGDGRQRPQQVALARQSLGDDVAAGRVPARQRDPVARQSANTSSSSLDDAKRRAGQNPVFRKRTAPSTDPFSRGVVGVGRPTPAPEPIPSRCAPPAALSLDPTSGPRRLRRPRAACRRRTIRLLDESTRPSF